MLASADLQQFNEAQTLDDIAIDQVHIAQQIALVRLHLFVVGEVHRMLWDVYDAGEKVLRRDTSNDAITPALAMQARSALLSSWKKFFGLYTEMMGHALREAASIPFGTLAVYHRDLILPNLDIEEARRRRPGKLLLEQRAADDDVFTQQLEEILVAAQQRVYSDGLRLSGRIWRLDQASRARIDQIVAESLANGWSAWETAQKLEQYLGPNQDCPRWIEARLMGMTKADIAVDNTGLLRGDECDGSGVAYNALRLARNEIQAVHHMATDRLFQRLPWIEKEQINLSPDHAVTDMCDDVVSGGDDGDGVYPKGEISLPLHVHCMCYKTAVLMEADAFVNKLKGWMTGASSWSAMDDYQRMIGGDLDVDLGTTQIGVSLPSWLSEVPVNLSVILWRMIGSA